MNSDEKLGVLSATGLLISAPAAGWMVAAGAVSRLVLRRLKREGLKKQTEVFAGGVIAGDALVSFVSGGFRALAKK